MSLSVFVPQGRSLVNGMETEKELSAYWDRRAPSYTDVIKKSLADNWD